MDKESGSTPASPPGESPHPWKKATTDYKSYLLRIWRSPTGENCCVLLEKVGSGDRFGFSDFSSLISFLEAQEA